MKSSTAAQRTQKYDFEPPWSSCTFAEPRGLMRSYTISQMQINLFHVRCVGLCTFLSGKDQMFVFFLLGLGFSCFFISPVITCFVTFVAILHKLKQFLFPYWHSCSDTYTKKMLLVEKYNPPPKKSKCTNEKR